MPQETASKGELSQRKKFEKAARDLECDDDPERFAKRLGAVVEAKPKLDKKD